MKINFSFIVFNFISLFVFSQKPLFDSYLIDSTNTHSYFKLTSYPFLIPKNESSFAFGPSISLCGKKLEVQIGVLYDIKKYTGWYHPVHSQSTPVEFHKWYLPVGIINYYFRISDKIKVFPGLRSKGWERYAKKKVFPSETGRI